MSLRYIVTLAREGKLKLWQVRDTQRDTVVASWGSRSAAEADAMMRNRTAAALP